MFVIGIAGQAQMGKDTLADRLALKLNEAVDAGPSELTLAVRWKRGAFAANVKKVFCDTFGVDMDFVEQWKTNPESPPGFDMAVRQALQFIGDGFRKIMSTIWLDLAFRDGQPKIISDVRYVNEFLRVHTEGGMNILVGRPDKLNDDPNGSEAQIRPYIDWCLKHLDPDVKVVDLTTFPWYDVYDRAKAGEIEFPPDEIEEFHVFVRNDGTKDELHNLVDTEVVPLVHNFIFEFPSQKEGQETECLISA